MSILKRLFGGSNAPTPPKEAESEYFEPQKPNIPVDELFTIKFRENGGKFLYCDSLDDVKFQFENILEENDWFESEALCFDSALFPMLKENNISYENVGRPRFLFTSCENLIAEDGGIQFSSNQIKQYKPEDLPTNIIVLAKTSQIIESKGDSLRSIQKRYESGNYPTNLRVLRYFKELKDEDFLNYGSEPKNLYLLLLEDL